MTLVALGSLGLGAVWGWLLALRHQLCRPWRHFSFVVASTLLLALQIVWLANFRLTFFFLGASAAAYWLHRAWLDRIQS